jgi:seryl-tRNA synthetase
LENHHQEVNSIKEDFIDYDEKIEKITKKMREILKPTEMIVYESLFVKDEDEFIVAKKLGFKTSEQKRSPGYKQIQNIKKNIVIKVKKLIEKGELDL